MKRNRRLRNVRFETSPSNNGNWQHTYLMMRKSAIWEAGLQALRKTVRSGGSPGHWRWALSCMAATSERGATGLLRRSELWDLLRHANASARFIASALEQALQSSKESETHLPQWLQCDPARKGRHKDLLNTKQLVGLLFTKPPGRNRLRGASIASLSMARWTWKDGSLLCAPSSLRLLTSRMRQALRPQQSERQNLTVCSAPFGCAK
jgi:hypothetical protein